MAPVLLYSYKVYALYIRLVGNLALMPSAGYYYFGVTTASWKYLVVLLKEDIYGAKQTYIILPISIWKDRVTNSYMQRTL
jgi:hypothetical protein